MQTFVCQLSFSVYHQGLNLMYDMSFSIQEILNKFLLFLNNCLILFKPSCV